MATAKQLSNAFEQIAPPSTSASKNAPCQVFINHRGTDTKHTLASSIYTTLHGMGVQVFLDKEVLQLGDNIPSEIQEAMRTSFLHIAILSPKYAESPWCLAELAFMLKTGKPIIPVFYNVDPRDVRYVIGSFGDAFAELERKNRYTRKKLQDWKEALKNVSFRKGQILKDKDDEGRLLKSVVNYVMEKSNKVSLMVDKHLVALDELVEDFEKNALEGSKNVQIVGIVGMGGSGKTTLAKNLYNKKMSSIYKCSFVFDIREAADNKNLYCKQKMLMKDLGFKDPEDLSFDNIESGKAILKCKLSSLDQVLIVLDDIDHQDQLDALLPITDFGCGSLIVVTSRERHVLQSWGISSVYPMKKLGLEDATKLLCWHAFLQSSPLNEFQDVVKELVQFCNGLPLSLKVFGGLLYGKPKDYWHSQLRKASRILPEDIRSRLKISFKALDEEEQEIFLDIACFFIGEEKNLAIAVWDGSGWDGMHSWEVLENKCLVEVDGCNQIKMHDQLRDLGREIAKKRSAKKRSAKKWSPYRVWSTKQITDIQKQATGRVQIRGIKAATDDFYEKSSSHPGTHFEECVELVKGCSKALTPSILVVKGNYFTEELATLFTDLLWLRWVKFPERALPSWLMLESLRVLELLDAVHLEELWNDTADPPLELRELNLEGALLRFPRSIGCLEHLKKISLNCMSNLHPLYNLYSRIESLPEGFCLLQSLMACGELTSLPSNIGLLTNLRHLDLSCCRKLRVLPDSFEQLRNLQYINFCGCEELTLTSEHNGILKNMTKLETLDFSGCRKVQKLPEHITNQLSLRHLYLGETGLRELPSNIGELSKLEKLIIGSIFLKRLPSSIGNLSALISLEIKSFKGLGKFPKSIGNLSSLTELNISCYSDKLKYLPESIGSLSSLTSLVIDTSWGLEILPWSIGSLSSLSSFRINCCYKLKTLPESIGYLSSLSSFHIYNCNELRTLPESIGYLSSLTTLEIWMCEKLQSLPESMNHLSSLTSLEPVRSLNELEETSIMSTLEKSLSKASAGLGQLRSLTIKSCPITEVAFLSRIYLFSNLKQIYLYNTSVSRISISNHCCPSLETLNLCGNKQLIEIETLPISVKAIELRDCKMLKGINVLSGMVNLEKLSIRNCGDELGEFQSPVSLETADQPLEKVRALPCWYICNLERMESLQRLKLSAACNISALEPCLKTIKKWPVECIICARTERGVESVMEPFAFPDLALVDSCVVDSRVFGVCRELRLKGGQRRCSNQAAMVCCTINPTSASTMIDFRLASTSKDFPSRSYLTVGEGKWVWLGVFTEPSLMTEEYILTVTEYNRRFGCDQELEKGMLVMGEQERVVEAFNKLLIILGNKNRPKRKAHLMTNKKCVIFFRHVLKRKVHLMKNEGNGRDGRSRKKHCTVVK